MKKVRMEVKVLVLVALVLLPLGYGSLSHIPAFYIETVVVSITDGGIASPKALKEVLASYRGRSLFSLSLAKATRELEALPLVESAKLRRKFPSTLLVEVTLSESPALVYAQSVDDETVGVYVVRGSTLLALEQEDWLLFGDRPLKVEIPVGYAKMMEKYGLDESFRQVMELAQSLEGNSTLITRIKYDNNSSNSFGKMVLELSLLHAQIWLREPVSAQQVAKAIELVQEDQRESLSFLNSHMMRYDLYKGAMVRRK